MKIFPSHRCMMIAFVVADTHYNTVAFSMRQTTTPPVRFFDSIDDLLRWTGETTTTVARGSPLPTNRPRVLHCHDYAGGYNQHADDNYLASFASSWDFFDLFVYFSHHRVVIPPLLWIQQCHDHDKVLLGTFLFEGGKDKVPVEEFLDDWRPCADKLVDLCQSYGFDGWLINFETNVGDMMEEFIRFLDHLQGQLKERIGDHAQVIYYDAHNKDGIFEPQNALLSKQNKAIFDACDGIFINYQWFEYGTMPRCKAEAGPHRQYDVYAGVDVYARNCGYEQGAGCRLAVESANKEDVSLAIFAPGWVQEKGPGMKELPGSEVAKDVHSAFWNDIFAGLHEDQQA